MSLVRSSVIVAGMVGALISPALYDRADTESNYQITPAEVITIQKLCYLEGREYGVATRTTITTDEYPCDEMEEALQNHPKYKGFDIHRRTIVEVSYVSPADSQKHISKIKRVDSGDYSPYANIEVGSAINIYAHKSEPDAAKSL
jgi:hypothetical protein